MENITDVNLELIKKLTIHDVRIISDLRNIAEQASKSEMMIKRTYTFMIGQEEIEIIPDKEKISKSGTWTASYRYEKYCINCTEEKIFKLFKAEYLMDHGMKNLVYEEMGLEEKQLKETCKLFNDFLKRTENLYDNVQKK